MYKESIDSNYTAAMRCVTHAGEESLPVRQVSSVSDFVVPGWNEHVQGKHRDARNAFLAWVMVDKPRQGLEFMLMKNTRAQFKLALRYCREHENMMSFKKWYGHPIPLPLFSPPVPPLPSPPFLPSLPSPFPTLP
jgi:hypothetical protein